MFGVVFFFLFYFQFRPFQYAALEQLKKIYRDTDLKTSSCMQRIQWLKFSILRFYTRESYCTYEYLYVQIGKAIRRQSYTHFCTCVFALVNKCFNNGCLQNR